MEQPALWDEWNTRFVDGSQPIARRAADRRLDVPQQHAGNSRPAVAGLRRQCRLGVYRFDAQPDDEFEYAANGIFFDDNKNLNFGPARRPRSDIRASRCRLPKSADGTSKTIMLSENLHTVYWTLRHRSTTRHDKATVNR